MLLVTSPALAHPEFAPTQSNRFLKLTLTGGGSARLTYTVMVGELPATEARREGDADGDGRLDEGEQRALTLAWQRRVERGLRLELDGEPVRASWDSPVAGGFVDPRLGPIPFSIDLAARLPIGPGEHTLRLDDTTTIERLGETEVRIEEGPKVRLLGAWQAREDGKVQTRFLFRGPKRSVIEDRSIGLRLVDESAPRRRRGALPWALIGLLLATVVAGGMVWRRRRGRREG